MNSALYKCTVMHNRLEPKPHRFHYNVFMFWIDLDEIDTLAKKFLLISRNRFNVFNFRDADHLQLPPEKPDASKSVKQHLLDYLKTQHADLVNPKIYLLTNLRTLGHQFNPVSFYFVVQQPPEEGIKNSASGIGEPLCCVAEVSNTFGEMKLYYLGKETLKENIFVHQTKKYFYVSPFIEHDVDFAFRLTLPSDTLNLRIDDYAGGRRIFISTLTGNRKPLTNARLTGYFFRFPFITLQVIGLIHWNALLLWLKKFPYLRKKEHPEQQLGVMRKYTE